MHHYSTHCKSSCIVETKTNSACTLVHFIYLPPTLYQGCVGIIFAHSVASNRMPMIKTTLTYLFNTYTYVFQKYICIHMLIVYLNELLTLQKWLNKIIYLWFINFYSYFIIQILSCNSLSIKLFWWHRKNMKIVDTFDFCTNIFFSIQCVNSSFNNIKCDTFSMEHMCITVHVFSYQNVSLHNYNYIYFKYIIGNSPDIQ